MYVCMYKVPEETAHQPLPHFHALVEPRGQTADEHKSVDLHTVPKNSNGARDSTIQVVHSLHIALPVMTVMNVRRDCARSHCVAPDNVQIAKEDGARCIPCCPNSSFQRMHRAIATV